MPKLKLRDALKERSGSDGLVASRGSPRAERLQRARRTSGREASRAGLDLLVAEMLTGGLRRLPADVENAKRIL